MKMLLTGNEAIARGAYEAGIHFASAYPGTPSTEIIENLSKYEEVRSEWSTNEKTAVESAIGASIAGGRALSAMKMVGVNVAADPLFTYTTMQVNGGFVFVSADDPSMFSSQNEQDNRNYARHMKCAMLEPSDPVECYQMSKEMFDISEELGQMVMLRTTTRVNHGKSLVEVGERKEVEIKPYDRELGQKRFDAVPAKARGYRIEHEQRIAKMLEYSENCKWNFEEMNTDEVGVITSGVSYTYAKEVFGDSVSYLKLGFTYPLPKNKMKNFASKVKKIYVIEELDPYLEEECQRIGIEVVGKELLPKIGELSTSILREKILGEKVEVIDYNKEKIVARPPVLCAGCPHRGFFYELGKKKNVMAVGDIGCYALGGTPPLNAKDTAICMGSAVSSGAGSAYIHELAGRDMKTFGIIGDSTFFHTGMNGVINAIYNKSNVVGVILDNRITAMTGHQDNPGTGFNAMGEVTEVMDIEKILRALGAENVRTINPHKLDDVKETLDWAIEAEGPTFIITRYPCALKKYSEMDLEEFGGLVDQFYVDEEVCIGCKKCTKTGCPAIFFQTDKKKSSINPAMCVGCSVCSQVCPVGAIKKVEK